MQTVQHSIACSDTIISFELTRKRVKNLNLRVRPDGSVAVSAAPRVPFARIEQFVREHAQDILRAKAKQAQRAAALSPRITLIDGAELVLFGTPHTLRVRCGRGAGRVADGEVLVLVRDPGDAAQCARALQRLLHDEAERMLGSLLSRIAPLFAPTPPVTPVLVLRDMKTRWGICRPREGRVTLNTRLVYVPPALAAYVVCHELAHFRYPDHSKQFYAWLAHFVPARDTPRTPPAQAARTRGEY